MATKQQSLKLDFLYQASHSLLLHCPQLSSFYRNNFQCSLRECDVIAEKKINRESCPRCGQIYLSGLNTSVTLEQKKRSKKEKQQLKSTKNKPNVLIYTCHACQYQRKFNGSFKKLIPVVDPIEKESTSINKNNSTIASKLMNNNNSNENNINNNNIKKKNNDSITKTVSGNKMDHSKNTPINSTINNKNKINANNNNNNNNKKNQQQQLLQKRPISPSNQQPSSKKAKKNQLQNLIANRKKEQQGGNSGGFGLNDFLSQL